MSEIKHLMRRAQQTIRDLRERNRVLSAQVFVVEAFHAALLGPPRGEGMSPDIVWEIERELERIDAPTDSVEREKT